MRALLAAPAFECFEFDQCVVGQAAKAPTRFATLRLPLVRAGIRARGAGGFCAHARRFHKTLRGRRDDASWRTADKKVYPPALCKLMAESILHSARKAWALPGAEVTNSFDLKSFPEFAGSHVEWDRYFDTKFEVTADFHDVLHL